jgi:hypothetical protein
MLSPPPSSTHSHNASAARRDALPHPRAAPLKVGSSKESTFIRYVDQQLLHIQRRFAKRSSPITAPSPSAEPMVDNALLAVDADQGKDDFSNTWAEDTMGYTSMRQACEDITEVVRVVWVSGTPGLQIPYLINLALLLATIVAGMPVQPQAFFRCVAVLDRCFASLIQGRDVETGEALPGFEMSGARRRGVSDTEKVRIRSLVERTRVAVVEVFKRGDVEDDVLRGTQKHEDVDMEDDELVLEGEPLTTDDEENEDDDLLGGSWDMQVARVYDRTIQELGDTLEGPGIGVLTESRG